MESENLADLALDPVQGIERGHGFLEHHGDAVAPDLAQALGGCPDQLLAGKPDAARGMAGQRIGQKLQDRERGHRLARSALADEREGFALVEGEAGALHGGHGIGPEGDGEIAQLEQFRWPAHARFLRGSKASRTAWPMKTRIVRSVLSTTKPVMPSQGA